MFFLKTIVDFHFNSKLFIGHFCLSGVKVVNKDVRRFSFQMNMFKFFVFIGLLLISSGGAIAAASTQASGSVKITLTISPKVKVNQFSDPKTSEFCMYRMPVNKYRVEVFDLNNSEKIFVSSQSASKCITHKFKDIGSGLKYVLISAE